MSNQQTNNTEKQKGKSINSRQGSGSEYHREHAGNVPDYGANTMDEPNAKGSSVQSAIQEEFNNPVIQESLQQFYKIVSEEKQDS